MERLLNLSPVFGCYMIWLLDYFSEHFDFSFSAKINLAQTKELEVGMVCGLIPTEMMGGCK